MNAFKNILKKLQSTRSKKPPAVKGTTVMPLERIDRQPVKRNMPIMTEYEKKVLPTYEKYGLPPAGMFGIAQAEGGKINRFNLGAHDSNPKDAMRFGSDEAEATAAAELIKNNPRYKNAYNNRHDPKKFVEAIRDAGYAGDPKTWKARSIASGGAGQTYDSWSDFVQDVKSYKKWLYR